MKTFLLVFSLLCLTTCALFIGLFVADPDPGISFLGRITASFYIVGVFSLAMGLNKKKS